MAFSKAHLYKNREKRIARIANALAHPARVQVISQLQQGEMGFDQLLTLHPLNKATLSHHLRTLRLAGLVQYSAIGNSYCYSLLFENLPHWVEIILFEMSKPEYRVDAA